MEATLSILETNLFKQLTHISLKFKGGNDEIVRNHLAGKLKEFKAYSEDLESKLRVTSESLIQAQDDLSSVSRDYESLKSDLDRRLEEKRLEEQDKLAQLRSEFLQTQLDVKAQHERDLQDSSRSHVDLLKDTKDRLELVTAQLSELTSTKYSL